jgi:hypothetical protein
MHMEMRRFQPAWSLNALLLLATIWAGCWGWVPHDERLDVPRGGAFPIAMTGDSQKAWVFVYENVIRDHDQSPAVQLYEIDLRIPAATERYRSKGYETSGIVPPSVVGKLSLAGGEPVFTGFGEFGFTLSVLDVKSDGITMLTRTDEYAMFMAPMPPNPVMEMTDTPWGKSWLWVRSLGNSAPFEPGWPPVFDSGPLLDRADGRLLDTTVVYAGCSGDACQVVRRDFDRFFLYGAKKDDPFAVPITFTTAWYRPGRAGFYAICGGEDAPRILTANISYAVTPTALTETNFGGELFLQPGSLFCSYPHASLDYLWLTPGGDFTLIDAETGEQISGSLGLPSIPQYGNRHDQTRFAAYETEEGWLVAAGVLVDSREGNGCNNYEYCKAAFNRFATDLFFVDRQGTVAWRLPLR